MKKLSPSKSVRDRFNVHAFPAALVAALSLLTFASPARASVPTEGTLNPGSTAPAEWNGNAVGAPAGGPAGEATCQDGINCDVFTLHLTGSPADYTGKKLLIKITFLAASDYDLYVHKDSLTGKVVFSGENGGPPGTSEQVAIDPATSGAGDYVVHVLYASAVPSDQYHGSATLQSAATATPPPMRPAGYITGGITFSNSVPLKAPVTLRDGEPSNRTDFLGNAYVGAIRGVPAGVDLWYFDLKPGSPSYDPHMRVPFYRGQPDAISPAATEADLGGDGGGDIDLAVSFGLPTGQPASTVAFTSLALANVSTGKSTDRGVTFQKNPLGNGTGGIPVDDREWQEFLGTNSVYLWYRTIAPAITQVQRSDDGGFTYGAAVTAGTTTQVGNIDVHQATGVVYAGTSQGTVAVGVPPGPGLAPTSYSVKNVASDPNGVAHLFFVTKVADDGTPNGTAYVCYSNDTQILMKHSSDRGVTWSDAVQVNKPGTTVSNVFPWMETGSVPGSVGVVWYGAPGPNDDTAEWKVYYAHSSDASSNSPTFRIVEVTEPEHIIHASNISEGGLTGANNRNLIDYFQVSFDPNGAAVIAYTDDHNDYDGHTYVAHQLTGPGANGGTLTTPVEGSQLTLPPGTAQVDAEDAFPPIVPGVNGEQVTDYLFDLQEGNIPRIHTPDASDVVAVRYDTSGTGDSLAIAATMRVSDLTVIPGQTTWQMSFSVNTPHSVLSPLGTYSFGASDHGDQFFLEADTDVDGNQVYSYGTAVRANDGKMLYTIVGAADSGQFNAADNTVSVQVSVAKLNAVLAAAGRPLISNGTVVAGLRARSYTIEVVPPVSGQASRQGRRDVGRGGTQFVVHDSAFPFPAPAPSATPLPLASPAPSGTPPTINLANISTRVPVRAGDGAGVAGFIVRTTASKRLIVRGLGPTLGGIADPVLEVRSETGTLLASSDNWRGPQQAAITASGLAPKFESEAAVIINVPGGNYSAILRDKNNAEGLGLVEVYDIGAESQADLGNIATRGSVLTGDNVLIGGFIVRDHSHRNQSQRILVRGIGPSSGVSGALQDPTLELFDVQGTLITSNNDWQTSPDAAEIQATTIPPSDPKESAIVRTLAPGTYTTILRGAGGGTGIGLVEVYNLGNK